MKKYIPNILIGLVIVILSPFATMFGGNLVGFFSTPKELKKTNERITNDSSQAWEQFTSLKDSVSSLKWRLVNQRQRINDLENKISNINHKLKIQ